MRGFWDGMCSQKGETFLGVFCTQGRKTREGGVDKIGVPEPPEISLYGYPKANSMRWKKFFIRACLLQADRA